MGVILPERVLRDHSAFRWDNEISGPLHVGILPPDGEEIEWSATSTVTLVGVHWLDQVYMGRLRVQGRRQECSAQLAAYDGGKEMRVEVSLGANVPIPTYAL